MGGTPVQDWMPAAAFKQCPSTSEEAEHAKETLPRMAKPWLGHAEHDTIAPGKDARAYNKLLKRSPLANEVGPVADRAIAMQEQVLPLVQVGDMEEAAAAEEEVASQFGAGDKDSQLYNAMIAPIAGYSIRYALWYQGEHNAGEKTGEALYSCYFGAMIEQWRRAWGIGDYAFVYAQLAPVLGDSNFTSIRLAQDDDRAKKGGRMSTTGMAVTIDLGDKSSPYGSVHSRNKTEVGRRLALQALWAQRAILPPQNNFSSPLTLGPAVQTGNGAVNVPLDPATLYGEAPAFLGTSECTECCAGAADLFQVTSDPKGAEGWVNATSFSVGTDGASINVGVPSTDGAYTYVRFSAQNYPECTLHNTEGIAMGPFIQAIGSTAKELQRGIEEQKQAERAAIRAKVSKTVTRSSVGISENPTRESCNSVPGC